MFGSRELSVEMTPAEDFFKFNPSSGLDFQSLWPLPQQFPESHPSGGGGGGGGGGVFLEQQNLTNTS